MFQRLRLFQFRNFSDQLIEFDPGFNIFVGANGQGKSNILESLFLLLMGQSFRPAQAQHFIQLGKKTSAIQAHFKTHANNHELVLRMQESRRKFELNGKATRVSSLAKLGVPIVFSPESLNSIKGADDERRQLIDGAAAVADARNLDLQSDFRKVLKTRNRILRDFAETLKSKNETEALLEAINPNFLKAAVQLTAARLKLIKDLKPFFVDTMSRLGLILPGVDIIYQASEQRLLHFPPKDIHIFLQQRMADLHDAELSKGSSLVGPQKHQISFEFSGQDSRFFCSQGQQRGLILAFKLAQISHHVTTRGESPILLLDDVLSELDEERRKSFVKIISELNSQVMITTTDYDSEFQKVFGGRVHRVSGGQLI
jgi:DNA replication and repair protein RecF